MVENSPHLLSTKLFIPTPRLSLVARPHLLARLDETLESTLALVCAPAGYGKTTLLAEWIQHCRSKDTANLKPARSGLRFSWVSLDPDDNDPLRFLSYLTASLDRVLPGIAAQVQPLLTSFPPPPLPLVLTSLINALDQNSSPVVIILDDYQSVSNTAIHEAITFFLDHLPLNAHLVLATRSDPPFPFARLRARSQLVELRAGDLRFSPAEAAAFLNQMMGLSLSPGEIAMLESRTEGWIAGLQMAALSMRSRTDIPEFIRTFSGSHRYILDFLTEEILSSQPEEIQTFLLQTSILERLCAPLCDSLKDEEDGSPFILHPSSFILELLDRSNLFLIPLDEERIWYRYHHLFADLLRARLEQQAAARVPELHRRAARWFEQNQQLEAAVDHALHAGETDLAASWIDLQVESLLAKNGFDRLTGWIQRLPAEIAASYPWLGIALAWSYAITDRVDQVEPYLQTAEAAIRPDHPADLQAEWRGQIACIRSQLAEHQGDAPRTIEMARQALGLLLPRDVPNLTFARYLLGRTILDQGDLDQAIATLTENIALCVQAGIPNSLAPSLATLTRAYRIQGKLRASANLPQDGRSWIDSAGAPSATVAGVALIGLGEAQREWNELPAAEETARRSLELSQPWQNPTALCSSYTLLARVLLARGDHAGAGEALRRAGETIQGRTIFADVQCFFNAAQVNFWLATGLLGRASQWARAWEVARDSGLAWDINQEQDEITYLRVLLAEGNTPAALPALERLASAAQAGGRLGRLLEIRSLQAAALWTMGEQEEASRKLEDSLRLAEPEGYLRLYLDQGEAMQRLLAAYVRSPAPAYLDYARRLLAAFPAASVPQSSARGQELPEPLTPREIEILGLIAEGLSNREIAGKLFLAEGTVKFYVHALLEKLQVHSRTQAIAAAKERRLI